MLLSTLELGASRSPLYYQHVSRVRLRTTFQPAVCCARRARRRIPETDAADADVPLQFARPRERQPARHPARVLDRTCTEANRYRATRSRERCCPQPSAETTG